MIKQWKECTGENSVGKEIKNINTQGISRRVLSEKEKLQVLQDMEEFSPESCKRNDIIIYLSLLLLLLTVITLIVIT